MQPGDLVEKTGGDYYFRGWVLSVFKKRSGEERVIVENSDGVVHIFHARQLRPAQYDKQDD